MHKLLIFFLLTIGSISATVEAVEIVPLTEIFQTDIEKSPIHFAIFQAHETGDLAILNHTLEREYMDIETQTAKIKLQHWDFTMFDYAYLLFSAWEDGITPLEYAIRLQNPMLVKLLITYGATCNSVKVAYRSAYHEGIKLSHGFPDEIYTYTPLYAALLGGNTEIIKLLLDEGANTQSIVKTTINSGNTGSPKFQNIYSDIYYSAQTVADYLNLGDLNSLCNEACDDI